MKKLYTDAYGHASVTLVKVSDEEWEIQNVWTNLGYRKKGHMRLVMRRVLEDADSEQVILLLTSGVGRASGMSAEELVEWYSRLGFDALAPGSYPGTTVMQRVPRLHRT